MQSRDTRTTPDGSTGHLGGLVLEGARQHGQRPFVTFSDGASGERTELGFATFENWTAKAANLLVEELGLRPGDVLATDLGTHWTALVLLAAAWRAGVAVALPGAPADPAAVAHREGRAAPAGGLPTLVVGTGLGARMAGDPGDALPFAEEVLAFPDDFPDHGGSPDDPLLIAPAGPDGRALSSSELAAAARALADRAGLQRGGRYLSSVPLDDVDGVIAGAVLPLVHGSGVVLTAATPSDALVGLAESERATALLVPRGQSVPSVVLPVVEVPAP